MIHTLALTMGVAWASGINLYAAVAVLGLAGNAGYVHLPDTLTIVEDPLVIIAACFMYCVEFFADKMPGVDSTWDALHTFIRIPAGAMLAAGAVGDVTPALAVAAGLVGGSVTAATHATKAGTRMLINTSPEPFSNWFASIGGRPRGVRRSLGSAGASRYISHPSRTLPAGSMLVAAQGLARCENRVSQDRVAVRTPSGESVAGVNPTAYAA